MSPRSRRARLFDAFLARRFSLPEATHQFTVTQDLRIPTRDGVTLLADRYAPVGESKGTVLIRSPYGNSFLWTGLYPVPLAARGYDVVLVRCRGTFGSGGQFEPFMREVDDAADTVNWMRDQPWFRGRFATVGGSYLGFTQWALLMDPPPELAAAVIEMAPHDFSRSFYAGGAFNLSDYLGWSDGVAHQDEGGLVSTLVREVTATRRQEPALASLPLAAAADELCEGRAPWFREWVTHRDLADPFWSRLQLSAALDRVQVPVLLQAGWQDLFLEQTLQQYEHLRGRGTDVGLTVGPWTHGSASPGHGSLAMSEMLGWLDAYLAGGQTDHRPGRVRLFFTGAGEWRNLADWPITTDEATLYPTAGGRLQDTPAGDESAPVTFTYDPADPTPTVGGRVLSRRLAGHRNDDALAARDDVLGFTGAPLDADLEVFGAPLVELAHASDNPHADLFVRISEVDSQGRSRNVSDGFRRLDPNEANGTVLLTMDTIAHRFAAGTRIRLLIAGGCFPRFERNLGTGEDPGTNTDMAPSHRTIDLAASRLLLPLSPQ